MKIDSLKIGLVRNRSENMYPNCVERRVTPKTILLLRQQQQFYLDRAQRLERARNPGSDDDVVRAPASPSEHEDQLRCRFLHSGKPTPGTDREMADQYEEAVVSKFRTFLRTCLAFLLLLG